ncbi:hypothetical protein [Micromonospora sp. b486]|uniref:hypothetical protein n=1 Tax=Micromonospora sp. b486 TaxID=3053986 RepID=UPI00259D0168|nr:hypothetical protein [Micromonospora sp. b486]MDM4784604.1 hypothetical protein [Micromonospora sp. b486]
MTRGRASIGSNSATASATCAARWAALGDRVLVVSGVYETPPWGDATSPRT